MDDQFSYSTVSFLIMFTLCRPAHYNYSWSGYECKCLQKLCTRYFSCCDTQQSNFWMTVQCANHKTIEHHLLQQSSRNTIFW